MAEVITTAGLVPVAASPAPGSGRRARLAAAAKAFREARSDDEAADALEAALLIIEITDLDPA